MSDTTEAVRTNGPAEAPDLARLFEIAAEQGGYFTTGQAWTCGYSRALLSHHVKGGRFIRLRQGLYRFPEYPSSPREDVLIGYLAVGKDIAVVSHESALYMLGLSDVVPDVVHVTVSRSRLKLPPLVGVTVHNTARLVRKEDRVTRGGVTMTSATRSIVDAAEANTSPEQIEMAVAQAMDRGMATSQRLQREANDRGRRVAMLIEDALRKVRT